jgi:PAS domain S-box-containing protein
VTGKLCWHSIQNRPEPCDLCGSEKLLGPDGEPSSAHMREQYHNAQRMWFLIHYQAIKWIDGQSVRLEIATDITKRKQAVQAVQEIQRQQKAILDNIPDMAWLKNRESTYIVVNEAFGRACGLKPEEVIGLTDFDIWPADLAQKYREDDNRVIECGERKRVEEPVVVKDGREIWADTIKTPLYGNNGEIIGTAGIARDITRRKRAEDELKKRERELEAKSRNLEEVNIALKVLLKRREEDKTELEEKVLLNIQELVEPYLDKLKKTSLDIDQKAYINIIDAHLNDIISPFQRNLTSKYPHLTPREIQIANLIKEGKTTKEIADMLNSSPGAVDFHRNNIRSKLGLKNKNANLRSYLISLA